MKDIAIYGAGGLAKEIASLIERISNKENDKWRLIGFFDDNEDLWGHDVSHYGKVLGGIEVLNNWQTPIDIAIAIGSPTVIHKTKDRITNSRVAFPNIISPWLGFADKKTFNIGKGNIIQGACWASNDVTIGNFNLLNGDVVVGHDVTIGDYNVFMPDIRISGEVSFGNENLIGVGSIILQQIKIGNQVHIGPGAVLFTKPKDGHTYIGNPAKRFKF